jgi:alkanesulfonate monooxygenase SsuD/methylene tetrahydromethanopterin reductase-like flavin-dependent oxidoreductase (luciferase family)
MTVVDVQFSSATADWPQVKDAALASEELGYGAIWVWDHLAGLSVDGSSILECFSWLGALAEATTSIELGSMVTNVWNRQIGTAVTAAASVAAISGRQFHFGIGAGTSPTSQWSTEQHIVGAVIEPSLDIRHDRVRDVLTLSRAQWAPDRDARFDTFPLPSPTPTTIVGVNSVKLSQIAASFADGINVRWHDPRSGEFLDAANEVVGGGQFIRTTWTRFEPGLLDPTHPERVRMTEAKIDRLVLVQFDSFDLKSPVIDSV